MSEKIQIKSGQEDGYTAKEAMKTAVEYMKTKSAHAIAIITLEDEKRFDSECLLFMKMFMRFLHKNQGRVLLLAENEAMILKLEEHIEENYEKIRVVEVANLQDHGVSADMILNRINGAEAECIIAALPLDMQEEFINNYRTALDSKIWLGVGTHWRWKKNQYNIQKMWNTLVRMISKKKNK